MIEGSPQHHLLNGPTQAAVVKTEVVGVGRQADSVSKANSRQMCGIH